MDKCDEKKIDYLNLHLNRLWAALIVLVGGLAGLILTFSYSEPVLSANNFSKIFLFVLGFFALVLILAGLTNVSYEIKEILNRGNNE